MMHQFVLRVFLLCWFAVQAGNGDADPTKCASKGGSDPAIVSVQYCLVTKQDTRLLCPEDKIVVLAGLQMAVKHGSEFCMKRVPGSGSEFCCYIQKDDILYDSQCLHSSWNREDRNHYRQFVEQALDKCTNTSQCVLKSEMFANLQKKIPTLGKYSSYFEVLYKCITAPKTNVEWCSSKSVKGKEIHFQGNNRFRMFSNNTCTCHVTSQGDSNVIVRGVDVRTKNTNLILKSGKILKNISHGNLPLFGLREIFSAKTFNVSVKLDPGSTGNHLWLHISATNGKYVLVNCGERAPELERTSTLPVLVAIRTQSGQGRVLWGYWPLVYVASGSLFTIFLVSCILISVLISNHRKKKRRRQHTCVHPPLASPVDFQHDPYMYDPAYASVLEDAQGHQQHLQEQRVVRSMSSLTADRFYVKPAVNNLRPPMAPPPPPPNIPIPGVSCDVSELEAFLECKGPSQRDRALRNSSNPSNVS